MRDSISKVFYLSVMLFICLTAVSNAQVGPLPTTPPPSSPPPSAGAPLDPLSWVILGAGGAAAAGKYYQVRKKK